eukprot:6950062-Alexandrium_andersonii.AAC.1
MSQLDVKEKEKGERLEADAARKLLLWKPYLAIYDQMGMGGIHPDVPDNDWDLAVFDFFYTHIYPTWGGDDE